MLSRRLKCWSGKDIQRQFHLLDSYTFDRLRTLTMSELGDCSEYLGPDFDFGKLDFRAEGLRTFKDVSNRFPKKRKITNDADAEIEYRFRSIFSF